MEEFHVNAVRCWATCSSSSTSFRAGNATPKRYSLAFRGTRAVRRVSEKPLPAAMRPNASLPCPSDPNVHSCKAWCEGVQGAQELQAAQGGRSHVSGSRMTCGSPFIFHHLGLTCLDFLGLKMDDLPFAFARSCSEGPTEVNEQPACSSTCTASAFEAISMNN